MFVGALSEERLFPGQGHRDTPCPVATGNVLVASKNARLHEHCQRSKGSLYKDKCPTVDY